MEPPGTQRPDGQRPGAPGPVPRGSGPAPSAAFTIRPIDSSDDARVAEIVRGVMTEFGCTREGFAIHDPEVDAMTAAYASPGSRFYVVELDGTVRGCGGYGPLAGTDPAQRVCELRKMYFEPPLRGLGAGSSLLRQLLGHMRDDGYRRCYLETTAWMHAARRLYEHLGFEPIPEPLGATGHGACDRFFLRGLDPAGPDPDVPLGMQLFAAHRSDGEGDFPGAAESC